MQKMLYILGFYPINGRSIKISQGIEKYNNIEIKFAFWNMTGLSVENDSQNYIFTQNKKHTKVNKLLSIIKFYFFLKHIKSEYKPDLILAYHWDIFIISKLVFKNEKIIYDISDIPGYKGSLYLIIKKIEESFISKNDILIFASRFFQEKYLKFNKNKSIILDNKPEKKLILNKEKYLIKNIMNDFKNISFAGVFRDLDVFKNIVDAAQSKNINLLFFGEGAIEEELKKYCKNKKNVYFYGRYNYEDIPKIYNISDAILSLYSNKDENTSLATGNKFFKVQAFKKIGIFPERTKMGDYMKENNLGLVVNPYSKKDIEDAYDVIITESNLYNEILKNLNKVKDTEIFWEFEEKKLKEI